MAKTSTTSPKEKKTPVSKKSSNGSASSAAASNPKGTIRKIDTQGASKRAVQYINPDNLHKSDAFTNVVVVPDTMRTVYVGGQNAVDAEDTIIGKGDIEAQAEQVLKNLKAALAAGGATMEDIIKWNVYVVHGQSPEPVFAVFKRMWGDRPHPPAITILYVSGLAHPDFLLEMDAIAVVSK